MPPASSALHSPDFDALPFRLSIRRAFQGAFSLPFEKRKKTSIIFVLSFSEKESCRKEKSRFGFPHVVEAFAIAETITHYGRRYIEVALYGLPKARILIFPYSSN